MRQNWPMSTSGEDSVERKSYRGGCHCGRIAYEVEGALERVEVCNCSICTKKGYLHWIVPHEDFQLLTPWEALAMYTFNTGTAKHYFCPQCGVASFYIARSAPDKIDINVRCLEGVDAETLPVEYFDGQNWEVAHAAASARRKADPSA
ncbi:MAG TPA: GFA family protein [Candidatus Binataceae bacterium]|nr:GFA family protein [Candidatus Binataceae bacterium]